MKIFREQGAKNWSLEYSSRFSHLYGDSRISEHISFLLLQRHVAKNCMASTCWLWYHPFGQATNSEAKHRSQSQRRRKISRRIFARGWSRGQRQVKPAQSRQTEIEETSAKTSEKRKFPTDRSAYPLSPISAFFQFNRSPEFKSSSNLAHEFASLRFFSKIQSKKSSSSASHPTPAGGSP